MEEIGGKLDKIVKHTTPKSSFMLTFTGKGSKIEKDFEPEISVTAGCHYEIAFTSLETYHSIPNVDETNNVLPIKQGKSLTDIKIET